MKTRDTQCCFNVGLPSTPLGKFKNNICSMSHVCWVVFPIMTDWLRLDFDTRPRCSRNRPYTRERVPRIRNVWDVNTLTAGVAYIRVFIFISTSSTTF